MYTDNDWGAFVCNKSKVLLKPSELLRGDVVAVVTRADNSLSLLASRLVDVVDVVEHYIVHLTYVYRVVSRTKRLAILCCCVKVYGWAIWHCTIIVVVTHSVKELCWVANIGKRTAEVADVIEVVVPVNLVCAVTQAEGVDWYASLAILLNLSLELRHKDIAEVAKIVVVVGDVDVGYGSNNMSVVVHSTQSKVVSLSCCCVSCQLCPELWNNITTLGHCLIAARNGDKDAAILLLRYDIVLSLFVCQHNLVSV